MTEEEKKITRSFRNIPDELWYQVTIQAAKERIKLQDFVVRALKNEVERVNK